MEEKQGGEMQTSINFNFKYLCWSSEEVKESCPETCGLCSESATECKDDYGTAFCSSMAMFSCNFNGDKCKKSCNRC